MERRRFYKDRPGSRSPNGDGMQTLLEIGREGCEVAKWIVATGGLVLGTVGLVKGESNAWWQSIALIGAGLAYCYCVGTAAVVLSGMPRLLKRQVLEERQAELDDMFGELRSSLISFLVTIMFVIIYYGVSLWK